MELIGGLQGGDHRTMGVPIDQADPSVLLANGGTVYGETATGKRVTLWDAERYKYAADGGGRTQEEFWHSPWVCIGAHLLSADERSLTGVRIAVDDLYYLTGDGRFCAPQWAQIEGVDRPGEQQQDGTSVFPYIIPVIGGLKADVAVGSTSSATYSVYTTASRPWRSNATEAMPDLKLELMTNRTRSGPSITLKVDAWARIGPLSSPASARDLLQETHPLLALMALTTFAKAGVASLEATSTVGEEISLLCHLGHPGRPESRATRGLVFAFHDVSLESFMVTWDRLGEGPQARYARNMTIGLIGHSPTMVEEHIAQVLGAAEGFHRWCLQGGNNPTLQERLIDLHDRLPGQIQALIGLDEVKDKWADWAVWARNNVDHGGAKNHRDVADFYHLKVIADSVRLVTYLAALQEFDVPGEVIIEALRNHPRLSVLAKRTAEIANLPAL
ncbi:hypothetical protein FC770_15965 [Nocardioides jishulii]|uniref:Uncharacterized protein n=1 Tax=Nocardioides jishulii TaxID=2575440 RepID=A0A4U2YIL2_9ACTN|nr:hypothetical protein FCL41_03585 [Nocardioides jishulii]TKI60305.1 hypothetical protein FC770_15965 [Nocardioides jishulii]